MAASNGLAWAAGLAVALAAPRAFADPISTSFTYQGQLLDAGLPANGTFDLQFRLFDSLGGLTQVGPALCSNDVGVVNGAFTLQLDFGTVLEGSKRFLEVSVRPDAGAGCASSGGFLTLGPRQELTAAPYASFASAALTAANAANASDTQNLAGQTASFYLNRANQTGLVPSNGLGGFYTAALTFSNSGNVFVGNGGSLTGLNAGAVTAGTLSPARGGTGSTITSATPGQVLAWNGTNFVPQTLALPTYSAGAGLTLTGTVFSIGTGQVTSAMIFDNSIVASDIAPSAVTSSELANDGASLSKVSGGAVSASGLNLAAAGALTTAGNITAGGTVTADAFIVPSTARSLNISAASFTGDAKIVQDGGTNMPFVSCGSTVSGTTGYAPVLLPHGAVVTKLTAFVLDSSLLSNVTVSLLRRVPDGVGGGTVASVASSGSDSAIRSFVDTSISGAVINNNTSMYYIQATFPPGASLYLDNPNLVGVKIDYTSTTP